MEARVSYVRPTLYSIYFYAYGRFEGRRDFRGSEEEAVEFARERASDVLLHRGWSEFGESKWVRP